MRYKTLKVSEQTHEKLSEMKPYDSMSFDDLLTDMAESYEPPLEAQ